MNKMLFIKYQKEYLNNIFSVMATSTVIEEYTELKKIINGDDANSINLLFLSHSGKKKISPLLDLLLLDDVADSKETRTEKLVDVLLIKYGNNWNKICGAFNESYNPLDNYNMIEHEEVNSKVKATSGSKAKDYGFNTEADNPVNDNEVEMENTSEGKKDDNFRDLTRRGNIGVTTSQQMLESELELRKYNLLDAIFNDIDKVICLKNY